MTFWLRWDGSNLDAMQDCARTLRISFADFHFFEIAGRIWAELGALAGVGFAKGPSEPAYSVPCVLNVAGLVNAVLLVGSGEDCEARIATTRPFGLAGSINNCVG